MAFPRRSGGFGVHLDIGLHPKQRLQ